MGLEPHPRPVAARSRVEFGDWQTPLPLANDVVRILRTDCADPASVLEPTCGDGAFLQAAAAWFPRANLQGFEIDVGHAANARQRLGATEARIVAADFFSVDWSAVVAGLSEPICVLGNPPWVTSARLGVLGARNVPTKSNFKGAQGLDARTGKSNFDISEWMLLHLIKCLSGRRFVLGMLCKSNVARQILRYLAQKNLPLAAALYLIDAKKNFGAAVDAVLLVVKPNPQVATSPQWPVFAALDANLPERQLGMVGADLCSDVEGAEATDFLRGPCDLVWRSGMKHDCAAVMEFRFRQGRWHNGLGVAPSLETEPCWYPLLKGSDVAAGRPAQQYVIVTQERLGAPTDVLRTTAPHTWRYLQDHADLLAARKSRIYQGQQPFAIFGIGPYAFAPYKVAICGLYKHLRFCVVSPVAGKPVMLDDTSYFLPCESLAQAESLQTALNSDLAQKYLSARVFWDMKRPVTKALLSSLCITRLLQASC